ncbi:hypothetical protein BX616_007243, partial [Lobosporangium transversale]
IPASGYPTGPTELTRRTVFKMSKDDLSQACESAGGSFVMRTHTLEEHAQFSKKVRSPHQESSTK